MNTYTNTHTLSQYYVSSNTPIGLILLATLAKQSNARYLNRSLIDIIQKISNENFGVSNETTQLLRSALVENHFICFHVIDDDLAVAKFVIVSRVGSHEGDCTHHGLSEHSRICLSDGCEVIHISSTLIAWLLHQRQPMFQRVGIASWIWISSHGRLVRQSAPVMFVATYTSISMRRYINSFDEYFHDETPAASLNVANKSGDWRPHDRVIDAPFGVKLHLTLKIRCLPDNPASLEANVITSPALMLNVVGIRPPLAKQLRCLESPTILLQPSWLGSSVVMKSSLMTFSTGADGYEASFIAEQKPRCSNHRSWLWQHWIGMNHWFSLNRCWIEVLNWVHISWNLSTFQWNQHASSKTLSFSREMNPLPLLNLKMFGVELMIPSICWTAFILVEPTKSNPSGRITNDSLTIFPTKRCIPRAQRWFLFSRGMTSAW